MRVVIQRVKQAEVISDGELTGKIGPGLMVLLGIEDSDTKADAEWLAAKVTAMRIFSDAEGKMNLSVSEIDGDIMVVSQFTLYASTKKGNRPGFTRAAKPDHAIPLYEYFLAKVSALLQKPVATGVFGADMKITLINDGPVTILMDSKQPE